MQRAHTDARRARRVQEPRALPPHPRQLKAHEPPQPRHRIALLAPRARRRALPHASRQAVQHARRRAARSPALPQHTPPCSYLLRRNRPCTRNARGEQPPRGSLLALAPSRRNARHHALRRGQWRTPRSSHSSRATLRLGDARTAGRAMTPANSIQ
ncbi:hypothetical protein OAO87_04385 [bacterium]|nr:hypothetical protein [bacterium]